MSNDLPFNTVTCADCRDWLPTLPDGCCSAVVTDPPYGVGIAEWDVAPDAAFRDECLRVATGPVVMFGAAPLRSMREFVALEPDRMLVWAPSFTLAKTSANGLFYRYHPVWCWRLPQKTGGPCDDTLEHPCDGHNRWNHPCTKPLPLIRDLVRLDLTGGPVCDPFVGSGTTAVAAVLEGRDFLACEISEVYCEVARRRVAEAQAQPRLPFGAQSTPRQDRLALETS